jgi:regulator of sirC expression with transglutaminase-like and TPR domain
MNVGERRRGSPATLGLAVLRAELVRDHGRISRRRETGGPRARKLPCLLVLRLELGERHGLIDAASRRREEQKPQPFSPGRSRQTAILHDVVKNPVMGER